MMIGVLPVYPSPHVSFVCWWLADGIGGWFVWFISCLDGVYGGATQGRHIFHLRAAAQVKEWRVDIVETLLS